MRPERPTERHAPLVAIAADLLSGGTYAFERAEVEGHREGGRDHAREKCGLIEPALASPRRMKRHREHTIDRADVVQASLGCMVSEHARELGSSLVFHATDRIGHRTEVHVHAHTPIDTLEL